MTYALRYFDFEVYPEWWCMSFGYDTSDYCFTITSDEEDARNKIENFFAERNFVETGYNIVGYDLIIANAIVAGCSCNDVFEISKWIVAKDHEKPVIHKSLMSLVYKRIRCPHYDCKGFGGLKAKEASMGGCVMETSVPFDKRDLTEDEKKDIIKYNHNDVRETKRWCKRVTMPELKLRLDMCELYNIDPIQAYLCTNLQLACQILGCSKIDYDDINRDDVELHPKIERFVRKYLPDYIIDKLCTSGSIKKYTVNSVEYTISDGGAHACYKPEIHYLQTLSKTGKPSRKRLKPVLIAEANDEWELINIDASSFYPALMVLLGIYSRSIGKPEVLLEAYTSRLELKFKPNLTPQEKKKVAALKKFLNTIYGGMGAVFSPMYDPYRRKQVCRYGQAVLMAISFAVGNALPDAKVLQNNTDGILIRVRRSDEPVVRGIVSEIERDVGFVFEYDEFSRVIQLNVNNYIAETPSGKLKNKGAWLSDTTYRTSLTLGNLNAFVSKRAVYRYLLYNEPVESNIYGCDNVLDFCLSASTGHTFDATVLITDDTEEEINRVNRIIVTREFAGTITKRKIGETEVLDTKQAKFPDTFRFVNQDLTDAKIDDYKEIIDYSYYVNLAKSYLNNSEYSYARLNSNNVEEQCEA